MTAFQFDLLHTAAGGDLDESWVVACCSWGNDSVALVQHLRELGREQVLCLYNDTGWSRPALGGDEAWLGRVARMEAWATTIGYRTARTTSMGMRALVRWKQAWPRQGMQFCTEHLKTLPTIAFLAEHDPAGLAIAANGKRRAESVVRRTTPEWVDTSASHGGRRLWQPLFDHDDAARDALLARAGFKPLPHKSRECQICVNENAAGLRLLPEPIIAEVEAMEGELGLTASGKPKTLFRPARKCGATGIREIMRWASAGRGRYRSLADGSGLSETESGCDGGFCAS